MLFRIDSRPFEAEVRGAEAVVRQNEAGLRYAKETNDRFKELAKKQRDAVTARELAPYQALEDQAAAGLPHAKANLATAQLNLEWTVVRSPIDGRIGRYYLTQGNLANQDKTQLATVVSLDPIHVHLDIDEATFMRLRKLADGPKGAKAMEIQIGLAGDDGYPHRAVVDFVDNRVNPATATIRVRAVLPNAKGLMLPGMFVRARLPIGEPAEALLVTDRVVQRKKAGAWLYVVNADNKVEVRYVKLGALQSDGLRVIASGLKKDDLVLVTGLNSVEPFMRIQPMRVAMPTLGGDEPKKEKKKPASEEASDVKAATWWISAKLKTARAKTIANAMSLAQARHRGILFRADSRHAVNPSADASPLKSKAAER